MIEREIKGKVLEAAGESPVIAITGPRQSGKTTLVKALFKGYTYVNLEDLELRAFAKSDPKAFLAQYNERVIIDEAQHAPDLFSYIQVVVDERNQPGQFILTGSQNFLLLERISQSLAGRVHIFHLLPLSVQELIKSKYELKTLEEQLFFGFYPRIYDRELSPKAWYANYLLTYVERDVRTLKNIQDLGTFQVFLKMCASRTGQLLDLTSIGNDCGISHTTVREWINILEASFIVFLLRPHHKNFRKRLTKSPKLYFYDAGLLCHLLDIEHPNQLKTHYLRGGIFESFVLSEIIKARSNQNVSPNIYYWRDQQGYEIDCIYEKGSELISIEIKSAQTFNSSFFKNLNYYNRISNNLPENTYIIYAGEGAQKRSNGTLLSWKEIYRLI